MEILEIFIPMLLLFGWFVLTVVGASYLFHIWSKIFGDFMDETYGNMIAFIIMALYVMFMVSWLLSYIN